MSDPEEPYFEAGIFFYDPVTEMVEVWDRVVSEDETIAESPQD